ncbi:hypothetical protein D3C76_971910 [compost metagenome]
MQPVGVQLDAIVGRGEVALTDIARAIADSEIARQVVGGPQVEGSRRGIGQRLSLGGKPRRSVRRAAGFAIEEGEVGEEVPLFGELAGRRQFDALHTLVARQRRGAISHLLPHIGFLHPEDSGIQAEAPIQQFPFAAQLPGLVLFRVEFCSSVAQARPRGGEVLRRRVEGVAVGEVDATGLSGLEHQPGSAAESLVAGAEALGDPGALRQAPVLYIAVHPVVAQAQAQVPHLVQGNGVERIERPVDQACLDLGGCRLAGRPTPVAGRAGQVVAGIGEAEVVGIDIAIVGLAG